MIVSICFIKHMIFIKIIMIFFVLGTVVNSIENEPINNVQEQISLDYVKNNLSPFEEVSSHWSLSFNARRKLLHSTDLYQYMSMFPIIKQPDGYELLINDFNQLYNENDKNLFKKWNFLQQCILRIGLKKKIIKEDDLFNGEKMLSFLLIDYKPY